MTGDITLGQYFPGDSPVHGLDPRTKILLTTAYMVLLFVAYNAAALAAASVFMIAVALVSRIPVRMVLRGVKPILPIIIITAVINAFYIGGHTLFKFYFLTVTWEGLELAVFMSVRIIFLIVGTSMMTYTTSPIALTDGLEELLAPLRKIKLPVHELSMMMTIALRFIPTLIEETNKIINAQKARGADFESGRLSRRIRALVPILIPLFISAFKRAEELAMAMDCRCYRGGEGRTKLRQLRFARADAAAALIMAALFAAVIVMNIFIPRLY
jgi:energy-coupling factor transport system permease protein